MRTDASIRRCTDLNISQLPHIFLETYTEDFAFWLWIANETVEIFILTLLFLPTQVARSTASIFQRNDEERESNKELWLLFS